MGNQLQVAVHLPFRHAPARSIFVGIARHATAEANLAEIQSQPPIISKEALVKMRKQTGYSYVKCRKALLACGGEHNFEQALRWIKETAVKEGWDKAAKLSTRVASQGLIGFASSANNNTSVLIELNCETDFVARSAEFKNLIVELVNALQKCASNMSTSIDGSKLSTTNIEPNKFNVADGRTAEEAIVATVGKIGENIRLARAAIISAPASAQLYGQTHPKDELAGVQIGRFVSLVTLGLKSADNAASDFPLAQLGHQICQHIIGMAPESLGTPGTKKAQTTNTAANAVVEDSGEETTPSQTEKTEADADGEDEDLNASQVDQSELTRIDGNETQLLHQAFMLNPEQTVSDYLDHHGATIGDFLRIEMGQGQEKMMTSDSA
uniref:Elongation factor Ts, mitochondrial n=1 Tax=Globodera rostochiensis TaxID=31243 RepID=A0A914I512_GLORO